MRSALCAVGWLLLLGCGDASDRTPRASRPPVPPAPAPAPPPPPPSITSSVSEEPLPRDLTYRLHRFPVHLDRARLEIADLAFDRTVRAELASSRASIVVNGGFWNPDREPEGLTVVAGRRLVPFEPELGGGVLVIENGRARILDAEAGEPAVAPSWSFAQQAKPRLVVDGAVNVERDTGRRADRTAVCLRDDGRTLEIVLARTADDRRGRDGPTLFRFAHTLATLGCEQALNLDGGPSSGIAWREAGEIRALPTRVGVRYAIAVYLSPP